jgi:hypothetical protein
MSTHRSVGLIGDSNHTSFVAGENSDSGVESSWSETNRVRIPNFDSRSLRR